MSQENVEVATRLVIFTTYFPESLATGGQIPVLTTPAAAIPLVTANGDELLATGRAGSGRVRVDAAYGVVRVAVPLTPASGGPHMALPTPGMPPIPDTREPQETL